ncbi:MULTISPECIES: acetyl-CoA carboxylase biotin carboxylase subunit family protein [unclassified Nocardiopsis]|uniref:ATP-grasp domain-containing protein n=1 Tax=unclassified Nocardiopsis TaxID=2649073 RepID=UPI001358AF92|nr:MULTISPECIES: ATP-grasp domain-containing protein [unclassified Nocardiopsis]
MATNVFVLGLDEQNHEVLLSLPHDRDYRFLPLLGLDELGQDREVDMPGLLSLATDRLDSFPGTVDAILGFWDFPVSSLVPLLCRDRGLPCAPLEAVVRCEHKYWSRLEQRAAAPEAVPRFTEVGLDTTDKPEGLSYPLWVKPVKSFSSELAYRAADDAEFRTAMDRIRAGAGRIGASFQWVMDRVRLPAEIAEVGGVAALVEEEATGDQLTVEGYVRDGVPHVYGIVDSHRYPGTSSFLRYEFPSTVPEEAGERLGALSERVVSRVGLDNVTFNIEYFHDPRSGAIALLEINPRHSQSHARLFELVRGVSNHEICLRVALGEEPELDRGGRYAVAAKWFLRRFRDGFVSSVPTAEDVARAQGRVPDTRVEIVARPGRRLSELPIQDSYSFELAHVFVGARDRAGCERGYRACAAELPFTIRDTDTED